MSAAEHLRVIDGQATMHKPVDPLIGTVLDGRYLVESVLGEGGMGLVYKARHTVLGKPLAIKVLRSDVSKDAEIIERFRQEAQSATSIGNEHIIDISDFGTLPDGSTYFVMEFLGGQSLTQAVERGPFPANRTIHVAKQLCRALGAAHERGIVHRDMKPDNIYLIARGGDDDFVKVLDFGIAKVGGATSKLTKVGQVFGTPHYMSPEQCSGANVDQRTDIYAIGVIVYEMACGRVPFDADNLMGILTKHLYEQPIRPHELPPPIDVPAGLEAIIMKCLAKSADARYQSMSEMLADLERLQAGHTPQAVVDEFERASSQRTDADGALLGDSSMNLPAVAPKKSFVGLAVGGLVALMAVAGSGVYFSGSGAAPAEAKGAPPVVSAPSAPVAAPSAPNPSNSLPAIAAPSPPVHLGSTPDGAEVYQGGALVGTTPLDLPRPAEGSEVVVELRKAGFKTETIRLSALTQRIVKPLQAERARAATPRRQSANEPTEAPAPRRRLADGIIDPFAN